MDTFFILYIVRNIFVRYMFLIYSMDAFDAVRTLVASNQDLKSSLKKVKLMTRDSRVKERKKYGKYGARRSPQFTKR